MRTRPTPWGTEKRRAPRARKARGGPPGVCWRCRRPCTSKVSCSRRGSGAKRSVACDDRTTSHSRRPRQDRDVAVALHAALLHRRPHTQDASRKIATWRSRCTQRSYSRGLARKTPAARSRRGGCAARSAPTSEPAARIDFSIAIANQLRTQDASGEAETWRSRASALLREKQGHRRPRSSADRMPPQSPSIPVTHNLHP